MMRWIFLGLAFCLSGCFAVPILAFEVTCSVTSIAFRATDPDRGSRIVGDSTPSPLFPGVAEGARVDEQIKEDAPPLIVDKYQDAPLNPTLAMKRCEKNGAGPDTDCVDYLTQRADSF
jgi:hypothetical protein